MHEYSIVASLVARVEQELAGRPGAIATRLRVTCGELSGVDPALLRTAFDTFRVRGACARAELVIEPVPARWRCARCREAIVPGAPLRCTRCGCPAELAAGDDLVLERIELEVPDV
jgi:hydrogenase nickel incorporation protein HypA/HybF